MKKTKSSSSSEAKAKGNKTPRRATRTGASLYQLIAGQPLFEGLNPRQLEVLAGLAMEMRFARGEYIFRKQDPANRFYVILEGKVELELASPRDGVEPIQTVESGDYLGWSWLFEPYSFYVSAKVTEPTRSIFFYGTMLRQHCEDDHDLGYELVKRIAGAALKRFIIFQQNIPTETLDPLPLSKRKGATESSSW
jgi:CRP/FNR family cyclic AMP-dependent transcriptional regulator